MTNVAPNKGGVQRNPLTIHAHSQLGAMDENFLQDAVSMIPSAQYEEDTLRVRVEITNDNTGHHIPTDSPLRHLILIVEATNEQGIPLPLINGTTVPEFAGVGDPKQGYYADLPGKAFAKVLQELWTDISPTGAYWNPTRLVSDNRLAAFATDTSYYTFAIPEESLATVKVTLLYRRAFKELMNQKGWDVPDIVIALNSFKCPR
jgi:hypothetical protein